MELEWFNSYFSCRWQFTVHEGEPSAPSFVNIAFSQCCFFDPVLFIIFINYIINCSPFLKNIMCTDDSNVFLTSNNINELLIIMNTELNKLNDRFRSNILSTVCMSNFFILSHGKQKRLIRKIIF